jgi:hypothetical protein
MPAKSSVRKSVFTKPVAASSSPSADASSIREKPPTGGFFHGCGKVMMVRISGELS